MEELEAPQLRTTATASFVGISAAPVSLASIDQEPAVLLPTGVDEFDRVLSGGLARGSVTLLGGEPGIGKSTLVLQICEAVARQGGRCLVATGEESVEQVAQRARRLNLQADAVQLMATGDVDTLLAAAETLKPKLLIVDSVQTMRLERVNSAAGSVTQVRECAAALTEYAKARNVATVLVGHVTKDGTLAGPRVLEHIVDTVIEFEGERHQSLRFLRAQKHRFGATDEVGVLDMTATGLVSIADASGIFLEDRKSNVAGSAIVPVLNGRRSMLVEVQSLVVGEGMGRRVSQGLDNNRLMMTLATLTKHKGLKVSNADVYATVLGGLRVSDPAIDLGLIASLYSSHKGIPIPDDIVVMGEVGLAGEIRKVGQMKKRLTEAARLGFSRAIVPSNAQDIPHGIEVIRASTIDDVVALVFPSTTSKRRAS